VAYKITVPQKNYIIGTSITADFVLVPLRKGVEITTIKMEVVEHMVLTSEYTGRTITHSKDHIVATTEGPMPQNSAHVVPEDAEDGDQLFDESHRFSMTLDLPKSLKLCRQSVDTEHMKVVHKLRLYVNLHNPEGHTSQVGNDGINASCTISDIWQLLVKNHLHLFISPNLPPNEDQSVLIDHNIISHHAMRDEANQTAPPTYGLHQLDELYSGIDTSGFITPGGANSGINTPFYSQSRSGSNEDIPSTLDAVAHEDGPGASASALHTRLSNLSMTQNSRQTRFISPNAADRNRSYHSSGGSTPHTEDHGSNSQPNSYRSAQSYFDQASANAAGAANDAATPEYDMEALARIPSYNTAVRTPARAPISENLPTYEVATSRPASPTAATHNGTATPSPSRSLDTLTEETERNTELNSRRASPTREGAGRGEQR
jgi:hypothetical protein